MIRDSDAETSIVSQFLMIGITILGMGIVVTWVAQNFVYPERQSAILERAVVENVWFRQGGTMEMFVRNTGRVDMTLNAIYVNGELSVEPRLYLPVQKGETIAITHNWAPGQTYKFLIVTERGSTIEVSYLAPQ